jgi:hypothetical protein
MPVSSTPARDRIVEEIQALVAKSVEANARLLQNGSAFLRRLAERRVDLPRVAEQGRQVLTAAVEDYVRLSTAHTLRLIDLGVAVSERLLGVAGPATPRPGVGAPGSRAPVFDLKLSGRPGHLCQTTFVLESDRTEPVTASFHYSLFVDAAGEHALDLPVRFEPEDVVLAPGQHQRVVVALEVPADTPPGGYHTIVGIDGMPGLSFRLLLEVEEAPAAARAKPTGEAAAKAAGKAAATGARAKSPKRARQPRRKAGGAGKSAAAGTKPAVAPTKPAPKRKR